MKTISYPIRRSAVLLLLCAMTLLSTFDLSGARIDRTSAARMASEFLYSRLRVAADNGSHSANKLSAGEAKELVSLDETDAYYVFTTSSERGFVIVAADDCVSPLVGYSDSGIFDADSLPPALAAYLSDYSKVVGAISSGRVKYQRSTRGGEAVGPLMSVKWNQNDPYNRLTPGWGGQQTYTGCVATAIAQVMKYHNFPAAGRGVAGDSYNRSQTVELGHMYDWNAMLDEYIDGSYSDAQAEAVATLMRDVGYAVDMSYGTDVSGAPTANIPAAMCRYFNYSPEIKYVFRSCYSTQGWTDEIRASLLRGEPLLYGGLDGRNSGHQFVCDGIDGDDMLSINWGWGGYGDGFFDMNILSPEYLGIGAGEGAYYREQDMIINIRPGDPSADYLGWHAPMSIDKVRISNTDFDENGRFLSNYEDVNIGLNFYVTNSTGFKVEYLAFSFAVMVSDASGNPVGVFDPSSFGSLDPGYYRSSYVGINMTDLISKGVVTDGQYSISVVLIPGEKNSDPQLSDILPLNSGDLNCVKIKIENGDVYLEDMSILNNVVPKLKLTAARSDGDMYCGAQSRIILTVFNTSSSCVDEEYSVYLVPESEDKSDIDLNKYSSCAYTKIYSYPATEREVEIDVWSVPEVPGRYRVYMANYSYATGAPMIVPSDEPFYIDAKEMPTDEVCMTSALKLNRPSYCRNTYLRLGVEFSYNNPGATMTTDIELWARPKGSQDNSAGHEFLLLRKSGQQMYNGSNNFSVLEWSEQDVVWFEELGEYEAYVKYIDAEGRPRLMAGDGNLAGFTLTASDDTPYAELAAPMVINGGYPVEAVDWTSFDVEAEIMSPTGMTIVEGEYTSVDVYRSLHAERWLDSFTTGSVTFEKTVLAPGDKTKIHASILYRRYSEESDLIGKDLCVLINYIHAEEGTCRVHPGAFVQSAFFRLAEEASGIEDVAVGGSLPTITVRPGGLDLSDMSEGSTVSLFTLDGRCVYNAAATGTEMQIDGVASGMYLLRVASAGGAQFTSKVAVK